MLLIMIPMFSTMSSTSPICHWGRRGCVSESYMVSRLVHQDNTSIMSGVAEGTDMPELAHSWVRTCASVPGCAKWWNSGCLISGVHCTMSGRVGWCMLSVWGTGRGSCRYISAQRPAEWSTPLHNKQYDLPPPLSKNVGGLEIWQQSVPPQRWVYGYLPPEASVVLLPATTTVVGACSKGYRGSLTEVLNGTR